MHRAKASCIADSASMKEKVPPVELDMACMAGASWSAPNPNVWTGIAPDLLLLLLPSLSLSP